MMRRSLIWLAVAGLALTLPALAGAKKKPPPPPPDSADDCAIVVEASVPDYLVLASLDVGVRCATVKQSITVSSRLTRDGLLLSPVLPLGSEARTCSNTTSCFVAYDLFSLDNQPSPTPGNQVYCATGTGLVGGTAVGPVTGCEQDERI